LAKLPPGADFSSSVPLQPMEKGFSLDDYDYRLPSELIAHAPAHPRDHARLLVYDRLSGSIEDRMFYELPRVLPPETMLVLNNSKVEKARLLFGNLEIFLLGRQDAYQVTAMVRPGKKFQKSKTVMLGEGISAEVLDVLEDGTRVLRFNLPLDDARIQSAAHTPFPPYINADESLADEYQTVFAREEGSKAAPTAGLHFTDELLQTLKRSGFGRTEVTLHVGLGTFAPVKTHDIRQHHLHSEWFTVSAEAAAQLQTASHITAVGTTSVRVLESTCAIPGGFKPHTSTTDIFIYPGYTFKAVDALITNFHLPKSSLLMLVAALTGFEEMHRIYAHAVAQKYRFFSFGDAMLIR
jgi:S-adenosylmethionine:tRNA ribosyltransferase-isomerase